MLTVARFIICLVGAGIVPFLIAWAYLYLSRTGNWDTGSLDWMMFAVALLIGFIFISGLPTEKRARVLVGVLYVPIISFGLFIFSLSYVCSKFSACL